MLASIIHPISGDITIITDTNQFNIASSHPNYRKIAEALKKGDESQLSILCDIPSSIKVFTKGKIKIEGEKFFWDGEELHNVVCSRILNFMNKALPFEPLVSFLDNLMENPSRKCVEAAYLFLEKCGLTITEDGCFLGFKSVRPTRYDHYSGKFLNTDGAIISMRRNLCDDSNEKTCSLGFHVGTQNYANAFHSDNSVILMVKVNPRDIVSVPSDSLAEKLRTCKYEVIKEIPKNSGFNALYTAQGEPIDSEEDDEWTEETWADFESDNESWREGYRAGFQDAQN